MEDKATKILILTIIILFISLLAVAIVITVTHINKDDAIPDPIAQRAEESDNNFKEVADQEESAVNKAEEDISKLIRDNVNEVGQIIDEQVEKMTEQEKRVFNHKFEPYESDGQTPGNVKALISSIIANNQAVETDRKISVISNNKAYSTDTELSAFRSSIEQGVKYIVSLKYNADGFIYEILIEKI